MRDFDFDHGRRVRRFDLARTIGAAVGAGAVGLAAALVALSPASVASQEQGVFDRPVVLTAGRTAVGGYVEGNSNYVVEDGIGEGFSMELRRFNIFLFSSIGSRIRFISELEFEHGTEEIALETALIDVTVNPSLVLRAGILLPPLGAFNVNHDSPRWNFVDRPLVSTEIIPATLSEMGFGVHGRLVPRASLTLAYDLYATNGLGDGVILNDEGRTRLASGKHEEQFGEDNNGSPAFTGRLAAQHARFGEVGASFYTGIYNSFRAEGEEVDDARRVSLYAIDVSTTAGAVELRGEMALASIDVPSDLRELFGHRQLGWHLDATVPIWEPAWRGFPDAALNADLRLEYVDFNRGTFAGTGRTIGDDVGAVVLGLSFRPVNGTVFKANYRRQRARDLANNQPSRLGALQVGFATYF